MKNILILNTVLLAILLQFSPFTATAQQSNQQEIEETIGWLKQYGLKFKDGEPNIDKTIYRTKKGTIAIKYNYPSLKTYDIRYIDYVKTVKILPLTDSSRYRIIIYFSGRLKDEAGNIKEWRNSAFEFINKEDGLRVFNAFKHLFELYEYDFVAENRLIDKNKF